MVQHYNPIKKITNLRRCAYQTQFAQLFGFYEISLWPTYHTICANIYLTMLCSGVVIGVYASTKAHCTAESKSKIKLLWLIYNIINAVHFIGRYSLSDLHLWQQESKPSRSHTGTKMASCLLQFVISFYFMCNNVVCIGRPKSQRWTVCCILWILSKETSYILWILCQSSISICTISEKIFTVSVTHYTFLVLSANHLPFLPQHHQWIKQNFFSYSCMAVIHVAS